MICKYCGKKIPDNASFCPFCGEKTESHLRREERDVDEDKYEHAKPKGKRRLKALLSIIAAALLVIAVFIVIFVAARPFLGEDSSDETAQKDEETVEISEPVKTMYISAEDGSILRSGPGEDSEAIHILVKGQEVQVKRTKDSWANVIADGVTGWCPEEYLSETAVEVAQREAAAVSDEDKGKLAEPSVRIESGQHWVVNTDGGLNLRCGPGQEYDILMVVPYEAEVAEEGRDVDWLFVKYDGQYGWINLGYITPAGETQ